ncbi:MAG: hypothetical protein V4671_16815 [Armatimonadota bacterium]
MENETNKQEGNLPPPTDEEISAAASTLARRVTPARRQSAINASKAPRPNRQGKPLSEEQRKAIAEGARRVWSERKASGETIKQGRAATPLEEIPCTCGGEGLNHKSTCPRGRAIRRRQKAGEL